MAALALWMTAGALLLLALGMLLWRKAGIAQRQHDTSAFVDRQIRNSAPQAAADADSQAFAPGPSAPRRWRHFWLRAGIAPGAALYLRLLLPGLVLVALAAIFGGILSVAGVVLLYSVAIYFRLWLRAVQRHQKMVRQLPPFLDAMIRLTMIGNSLDSAFQAALPTVDPPLSDLLERANRLVQAGLDLEPALTQEARIFRLPEVELIAAVIGLALRFGGRADMVLERMAGFMRDREHAQQELMALSAEIRLSAWILGLLPVALSTFLIIFNNNMFMLMLADPVGEKMLIGAGLLEVGGAYWLYRLAKSI
jgi:tight adherence protein B